MLYEGMRAATVYGRRNWSVLSAEGRNHEFSSLEELIMGGTAGGRFTNSPLFDVHFMSSLTHEVINQ